MARKWTIQDANPESMFFNQIYSASPKQTKTACQICSTYALPPQPLLLIHEVSSLRCWRKGMELLSQGLGIGSTAWATITHMLTKENTFPEQKSKKTAVFPILVFAFNNLFSKERLDKKKK